MECRADDGRWGLVGGKVEADESLGEALCREVLEETGLHVSWYRLFGAFSDPSRIIGVGWRAYDIASFCGSAAPRGGSDLPNASAFVAGYEAVRPLAEWEREALPLFHVLRGMFRLGNAAARVDEWGTSTLEALRFDATALAVLADAARVSRCGGIATEVGRGV